MKIRNDKPSFEIDPLEMFDEEMALKTKKTNCHMFPKHDDM
jgi:hypothetical protein